MTSPDRGSENSSSPPAASRDRSPAADDASSASDKKCVSPAGTSPVSDSTTFRQSVSPFAITSLGAGMIAARSRADNAHRTVHRTRTCPADSPTTASSRSRYCADPTTWRCALVRSPASPESQLLFCFDPTPSVEISGSLMKRIVLLVSVCLSPLSALAAEPPAKPPLTPGDNLVVDGVPPIPGELPEQVGRYTESRAAGLQDWHPTRPEMLITTRFGDTNQIHASPNPGGARTQLTFFPDRVDGASFEPTKGEYFVFSKGAGGNEFNQNYRYDLSNGRDHLAHRRQVAELRADLEQPGRSRRLHLHPPQRRRHRHLHGVAHRSEERSPPRGTERRRLGAHRLVAG